MFSCPVTPADQRKFSLLLGVRGAATAVESRLRTEHAPIYAGRRGFVPKEKRDASVPLNTGLVAALPRCPSTTLARAVSRGFSQAIAAYAAHRLTKIHAHTSNITWTCLVRQHPYRGARMAGC